MDEGKIIVKILHINSYYILAPLYKNLYDLQVNNGIDMSVYVPTNEKYKNFKKDLGDYSQKSVVFNDVDRLFFFRKHKKILKDIKEKYNISDYQLVHAHSLFSNGYIAYCLNKEFGTPYIVAVRNTDVNVFFKKMPHLRFLGRKILENAEKIIFISEPYKEQVLNKYINKSKYEIIKSKSIVIPNGINQYWMDNKNESKPTLDNSKSLRIICVGDIEKNKNYLTTVAACEDLIKEGYEIEFNVVGRVNDDKIFAELSSKTWIIYHGTMKKEQLIQHLRKNDVFIMPSFTETFGLVYAEAMSQALPVIYTKNQGFDAQFNEGTVGFHVDPHNKDEIVEKIIKIIDNYDAISNNCVKSVDKFDWRGITNRYTKIYEEIID